eukprot:PhF_6_TR41641/c0_g1_i1/m.63112/K14397/NUDT21, CPSF5, CFIM25; cleavage and polyadenylation specificity factor subunit 5
MISHYDRPKLDIYPIDYYNFCDKQPHKPLRDCSSPSRLQRLKRKYDEKGTVRSVSAVIVVHQNSHPCIFVLQSSPSLNSVEYRLPGGKCREGEDDITCLQRKIIKFLGQEGNSNVGEATFTVRELIAEWVRPNFESLLYPYLPPHVSKPKEVRRVYMVQLPPSYTFSIPKNMKLLAVPLIELYDNNRYGCALLAALPQCMSRYSLNYR